MPPIDWTNILADAGTIAAIASALVIAIQFLKVLYYKLPWGWVQRTPSEVWFVLSVLAGLGVAIGMNYNILLDTGAPLMERFGTVLYGLTIGAGSKVIHAVASTAGAKFNSIKANNETVMTAPAPTTPEACNTEVQADTVVLTPAPEVAEQVTPVTETHEVVLVKSMKDNVVYVMLDGKKYSVTGRMLELDVE